MEFREMAELSGKMSNRLFEVLENWEREFKICLTQLTKI
jgi:hypothetical protein